MGKRSVRGWTATLLGAWLTIAVANQGWAQGSQRSSTMRFDCISMRTDGRSEPMEHDVIVDLANNAVSDNGVVYRNGAPGGDPLVVQFTMTAPQGARWGSRSPDGKMIYGEFRLDASALTYGFFPMAMLRASGRCTRTG